jgi:hypothetical protein
MSGCDAAIKNDSIDGIFDPTLFPIHDLHLTSLAPRRPPATDISSRNAIGGENKGSGRAERLYPITRLSPGKQVLSQGLGRGWAGSGVVRWSGITVARRRGCSTSRQGERSNQASTIRTIRTKMMKKRSGITELGPVALCCSHFFG